MKGEEVKKILKANGITHKMLAEKFGTTIQNIGSLLSKDDVRTGLLEDIVRETGIPMSAFYPELGDVPQDMGEVSKMLAKKDEQIDRLLTILEKISDARPSQIGCKKEETPGNA